MAVDKRIVHQWGQVGSSVCDDGHTRHWTEIRMTTEDLLSMLGCPSGSTLISLHIDRNGFSLTITADEHLEAPCQTSAGQSPAHSPGPSGPSSPPTTTST